MTIDKRARARIASVIAFFVCLPVGFYIGITLIGHARFIPYWSTWTDRLILAGAAFGVPALAAFGTYRFLLGEHGGLATALFWSGGVVLAVGGIAFVVFYMSVYLESVQRERIAAQTRVSNVQDEPILSRERQPIGLRVSFVAELSSTRHAHEIQPQLSSGDATVAGAPMGVPGLSLDVKHARVNGGEGFRWSGLGRPDLAPGRHEFVFDLYPHLVDITTDGEPCLSSDTLSPIPSTGVPAKLRLVILGTPYGATVHSGRGEETRNYYDIVDMYRAAIGGAITPCPQRD
jgi:hypothetical protein